MPFAETCRARRVANAPCRNYLVGGVGPIFGGWVGLGIGVGLGVTVGVATGVGEGDGLGEGL
jgi:hypothetical protein